MLRRFALVVFFVLLWDLYLAFRVYAVCWALRAVLGFLLAVSACLLLVFFGAVLLFFMWFFFVLWVSGAWLGVLLGLFAGWLWGFPFSLWRWVFGLAWGVLMRLAAGRSGLCLLFVGSCCVVRCFGVLRAFPLGCVGGVVGGGPGGGCLRNERGNNEYRKNIL